MLKKSFKMRADVSLSRPSAPLNILLLAHSLCLPWICALLRQPCSAHHARKLPFWQNIFGSKARETGGFRTAWAPVMSLTECQKSEHTCWEPNLFHQKNPLWSYKLLDSSSQIRVRVSLPVTVKDDESHHRCALLSGRAKQHLPGSSPIVWLGVGRLSRLLAWVFLPSWSCKQMKPKRGASSWKKRSVEAPRRLGPEARSANGGTSE